MRHTEFRGKASTCVPRKEESYIVSEGYFESGDCGLRYPRTNTLFAAKEK